MCSGLNLALMSLDVGTLQRKARSGNKRAKKVLPLRKNSHLSLASILLSNVAVISITSLFLGNYLNGFVAGSISTLLIVIFGEILPQAISVKHALPVAAYFATPLKIMIIVTYPVAKPLQLLLDNVFGHDSHTLHSRQELGLIIAEHIGDQASELDDDEVEIMRGALSLSDKRVRDIATDIADVFWLKDTDIIDGEKIDLIKEENYSRIPILNSDKTECYGVLLMKDLVDIDFDEQSYKVTELPLKSTKTVGSMTALDTMFRKFITAKSHLIPVEKSGRIVSIVTIEDLIEEIIGHEIEDESDAHR